jgi:hypothetical protein
VLAIPEVEVPEVEEFKDDWLGDMLFYIGSSKESPAVLLSSIISPLV